jgi:hypothetical protein
MHISCIVKKGTKCSETNTITCPCETLYVQMCTLFCTVPFMYSLSLSVSVQDLLPTGEHPIAEK